MRLAGRLISVTGRSARVVKQPATAEAERQHAAAHGREEPRRSVASRPGSGRDGSAHQHALAELGELKGLAYASRVRTWMRVPVKSLNGRARPAGALVATLMEATARPDQVIVEAVGAWVFEQPVC